MSGLVSSSNNTNQLIQSVCAILIKGRHWSKLLKPPHMSPTLTSPTNINRVLLQLSLHGYGPSLTYTFFKWVESNCNCKHSLQTSWTMICVLTKHRHFQTAHILLDKIAQREFLSTPSVLNTLVGPGDDRDVNSHVLSWLMIFYVKSKETQNAIEVFEFMRLNGFKPHLQACTVVLNSLVKDRLTDKVWKVYKKMVCSGIVPNIHLYNVLIHSCCKSGDLEKAENLLNEMESKSVFPDLFTFNTLISLYCKKSMHYEALCVQDRMERGGVKPDIVSYNSLIYGFCKEGRMREAVRFFRETIGATAPNHVTYTTLIDGYCRVNDLEEALRLVKVMEARGLYPSVVTYNSILRKLCEEGRMRDAKKLLIDMSEREVKPDNVTCNTLVNAYCKIGDMRSALKVKNTMLEDGLKPDNFTYKALIHGFCKMKEMDCAKESLFTMLNEGFCPSYCTYSWLVDAYCDLKKEEEVLVLLDEFVKRGLVLDLSVFRALIRRLCKREMIACAEKVLGAMRLTGISGDSVIFTSLGYAHWKNGDLNSSNEMLCEMEAKRLKISLKIYECFSASYVGDNDVLSLFWDHLVQRGLMSKSIGKKIHEMNLHY